MNAAALITVRVEQDKDIARLRQVGMALTKALDFGSFAQTRIVTAIIELARNALQYAGGGRVQLSLTEAEGRLVLRSTVSDQGEGVAALDEILSGRPFKSEGMGLGLRGVKSVADRFDIRSGAEGTRVTSEFATDLTADEKEQAAERVMEALAALGRSDAAAVLAAQNRELVEALEARDLLMREIHHRTANNLALVCSLIRMSLATAKSDETKSVLGELDRRVNSVVKAHQHLQLSEQSDALLAEPFLRTIAQSAGEAFNSPDLTVDIRVGGDELLLAGSAAISLGLVVGELITNAFKHAFVGRNHGVIEVSLTREEDGVKLVVADDGRGLPEGAERPERSQSLGWRMIRSMAKRHDGGIEVESENGLRVCVTFGVGLEA